MDGMSTEKNGLIGKVASVEARMVCNENENQRATVVRVVFDRALSPANENKSMPVVYIAGPFTGDTPYETERNIRRAEAEGLRIASLGASPLVPHSQGRFAVGTMTPQYWYDATMAQMLKCDAVLMLPGWSLSVGAVSERTRASQASIPVFYSHKELGRWIEKWDKLEVSPKESVNPSPSPKPKWSNPCRFCGGETRFKVLFFAHEGSDVCVKCGREQSPSVA